MKEKILQFAKGDFQYEQPKILLSEDSISLIVEAGRTISGSFIIRNQDKTIVKGILYSSCRNMKMTQNQFQGEECVLDYIFHGEDLPVGENVKGTIHIISNCGEYYLPFHVTIEIPSCKTSTGKIRDLFHFANLAKDYPVEALKIFKSPDFEKVFLYRDPTNTVLYRSLRKSTSKSQAMEEFLISIHKKMRINLQLNKNNLEFKDCQESFMERVQLQKDTWGYTEIRISSDAPFLIPEHKILWTDNFIGNSYPLEFVVDTSKMRKGKNHGKIRIQTVHQTLTIEVNATLKIEQVEHTERNRTKEGKCKLLLNYMDFRMNQISPETYISQTEALFCNYERASTDASRSLIKAHLALISDREQVAADSLQLYEGAEKPKVKEEQNIIEFTGYLYLKAMHSKQDADIIEAIQRMEEYYENGYFCWQILWFLLYLDKKYENPKVRIEAIRKQLTENCYSPVMYYEAFSVYQNEPELLRELDAISIRIMTWGIRKGMIKEELALRFTFQAGRIRTFKSLVMHSLEVIYDQFKLKDALITIISMLIRNEKTSHSYFRWYKLGVQEQLRITDIYEYYMYSMDEREEVSLPQSVLLYFMYENHMSDRKKAFLYACIIKEKEKNVAAYRSYLEIMERFARKQILARNINANLAIIYEHLITRDKLDLELAKILPEIMFQYEISCINPNMNGVYVVHRELEKETFSSFVEGNAQIGLFTENTLILLADKNGNRYVDTVEYTVNKLLHLDDYANRCYEISIENPKLLIHLYGRLENCLDITEEMVGIRRRVMKELTLQEYDSRRNNAILIQYYYDHAEGELLEELLLKVDISAADPAQRSKWIELCIIREMYEKSMGLLEIHGFEGLDIYRLAQLCTQRILQSSEKGYENILLDLCHFIFLRGHYKETILKHLVQYFVGTTKEMLDLWKVAEGFDLRRTDLEERLLVQILFAESYVKEGIEVLSSFQKTGDNRRMRKAYLSYLAFQYVVKNQDIPIHLFEIMKKDLVFEENKVCMLALLKYYSEQLELTEEESKFADFNISKFIDEGMVLAFFQRFRDKIHLPASLVDQCFVEHTCNPNKRVWICYPIDGEDRTEEMKKVYYGICAKDFVLFCDEEVEYTIWEEDEKGRAQVSSGTLKQTTSKGMESGNRFQLLNHMILAKEDKDSDKLLEAMDQYLVIEYVSDKLFKPL